MSKQITLVIPGLCLFDKKQMKQEYPALYGLATGTKFVECPLSYQQVLQQLLECSLVEYQAPLLALAKEFPVEQHWWLRVEPVQIETDQRNAFLLGNRHLTLEEDEAKTLVTTLNQFLKEDGLELLLVEKMAWYLRFNEHPGIQTYPLHNVIAKNIYDYLPTGEREVYWRRLWTELQMLLHQAPSNQQRRSQNQPVINGLWLWGEGRLSSALPTARWTTVCSSDLLVEGYARWLNQTIISATLHFEEYFPQLSAGRHLWVVDELRVADIYLDEEAERHVLAQLETQLFVPLMKALKRNQVDSVDIYFPTDCILPLNPACFKPWWRGYL